MLYIFLGWAIVQIPEVILMVYECSKKHILSYDVSTSQPSPCNVINERSIAVVGGSSIDSHATRNMEITKANTSKNIVRKLEKLEEHITRVESKFDAKVQQLVTKISKKY